MNNVLYVVLTDKGGVGKSFAAQILCEVSRGSEATRNVRVIDSDLANSSMAQIVPEAKFAGLRDANDIQARGVVALAVKDLGEKAIDAVVWDTAAGTEEMIMTNIMPSILERARKGGTKIVCLRLITTSQYTQDGALAFANWARAHGVGVIYVRNLGQGRATKFFAEWENLAEREASMPPAVEIVLPDLGCWIADEAASLGLGLADIAVGAFDRLSGRAFEVATHKFGPEIQLAVADYLELRRIEFERAIAQVIKNIKDGE